MRREAPSFLSASILCISTLRVTFFLPASSALITAGSEPLPAFSDFAPLFATKLMLAPFRLTLTPLFPPPRSVRVSALEAKDRQESNCIKLRRGDLLCMKHGKGAEDSAVGSRRSEEAIATSMRAHRLRNALPPGLAKGLWGMDTGIRREC
mmetsp:Transcript_2264/g.6867  ORF Transcript_2264/g.6867 Transcript_2264/m.6867 type:complete len:151 (+) Transcript_2264:3663-4115(+)